MGKFTFIKLGYHFSICTMPKMLFDKESKDKADFWILIKKISNNIINAISTWMMPIPK